MNSHSLRGLFRALVVLGASFWAITSSAQGQVVFSDSFESGTGNWAEDSQNDWFGSTQRATDGSRSAEVDGSASDAALISPVFDLQGATSALVSFDWYIERRVDSGEYIAFDVSLDGGNSWSEYARLRGNSDPEDTWHHVDVEIGDAAVLSLRFRGKMSRSNEDANIDNVKVTAATGSPSDDAPAVNVTSPPDGATVGGDVLIAVEASDDFGIDRVDFRIDGNLITSVSDAPYQIAWATAAESEGSHSVTVTAVDTIGQSAADSITVTVENQGSPPSITSSPPTSAVEGATYTYSLIATDPDANDVLGYSLDSAPAGMTINPDTGHLQWIPSGSQIGSHYVECEVTDSSGLSDSQGFTIVVSAAPSQSGAFSESFESGLGAWTQDSQSDWFRSSQRAKVGSGSAEVDGYASNAALKSPIIDLHGQANAVIDFSWFIERGVDSGEYLAFDISTNGGSTWTELARLRGNSDTENVWHDEHFELNDLPSLRLRFRGKMTRSNEDANVDNVVVTTAGGDPGPSPDNIPPEITILSPTTSSSYTTSASTVTVSGSADDNVGLATVTWRVNGGSATNASGFGNWTTPDISLAVGSNTIEVTASDAAGNSTSAQIIVQRDQAAQPVLHGIAIMGDSNSDEYRADDNRGGAYSATTLNWMEQLAQYRGLNFGTWGNRSSPRRSGYGYNWAISGATASSMIGGGQHNGVAQQISAGDVSLVVIHIGTNDFARERYSEIYNGSVSGQNLNNKIQSVINNITQAVDTVLAAGPVKVVLTDIYDYSLPEPVLVADYPDAARRQAVTNAITSVNSGLTTMAQQRGIELVDLTAASTAVFSQSDANWNLNVGGELIDMINPGNEPHHAQLDDASRHAGTVISGFYFANAIFIATVNDAFGTSIAPLSDAELLQAAGIN